MRNYLYLALLVILFACSKRSVQISQSSASTPHIKDSSGFNQAVHTYNTYPQPINNDKVNYEMALQEMQDMLEGKKRLDFKRAVFITENAYYGNKLNYQEFCDEINKITYICKLHLEANKANFKKDSFRKNWSLYTYMCDTIKVISGSNDYIHLPYKYDFDDFNGNNDWTKMFVTKLLKTNSGNCHSMPFLYKILATEINTDAYLSLAPNHIYVKHRNEQEEWYNTELTSGSFPIDAWVSASGYISTNAIRKGVYMDTLSLEQSIALCLIDLAKGYEKKNRANCEALILKCCDLTLKYFPYYLNAIVLKAETQKKAFDDMMKRNEAVYPKDIFYISEAHTLYKDMEKNYVKALQLGYREMPEEMYIQWLASVKEEKYKNKEITK